MNTSTRRHLRRLRELLLVAVLVLAVYACDAVTNYSSLGGIHPIGSPPVATQGENENSGTVVAVNPDGSIPIQANKPQPPPNNYQGCPANGDGGDPRLNIRKNRVDAAPWYPVSIANILALSWPRGIETQPRSLWTATDTATVARYEGIPVQIEGWLAGARQQGPESCNCHSVNDVDNHLWIVDSPTKGRDQSIVAEVTPRVRAQHPGWAFPRILGLVDGQTRVRISGWLMMDQEHPDQVGKTRGTIWEIHPIIGFDVLSNGTWISLDTGRISNTTIQGSDAVPTTDPNLPPPISDPIQGSGLPLPTETVSSSSVPENSTSSGPIQISNINYNGSKGLNEPDEYVEISNVGTTPVNLEGWVLHDIYGSQEFRWQSYILQGGSHIRVYTNEIHNDTGGFSFGSKSAIWANKGDAAELLDAGGTVVSTFSYGIKK